MRAFLLSLLLIGCAPRPMGGDAGMPTPDAGAADSGWVSLFDGSSFAGWDKYLGSPTTAEPPLGLNNDPRSVFTIVTVDGEPAIRISGEVWGALVSNAEYGNFDLHAEYKWGTQSWPPPYGGAAFFDSGLMYLTTGPYGAVNAGGDPLSNPAGSGAFQVSLEYQLAPGDIGALYNLGPIRNTPGPRTRLADRAGWNEIDISVRPGVATHFLNGVQVASATGFQLALPGQTVVPLTRGRLQLQCEGGEIFFRRLRLHSED